MAWNVRFVLGAGYSSYKRQVRLASFVLWQGISRYPSIKTLPPLTAAGAARYPCC